MISKRVAQLKESTTLKLNARVGELQKQGVPILNLTAGEPDFLPVPEAYEFVQEALRQNKNKYTPTAGLLELREKISNHQNQIHSALLKPWTSKNVVVSNGGKQALFNSVFTLMNEGDEAIIPSPYWLSYPEMVKAAGGVSVFLETHFDQNFKLTPKQLADAITDRTRVLFLNSPSNPTGVTYSTEDLKALGQVLQAAPQVFILSDEIYDQIFFESEGPAPSFLSACPELQSRTITLNGLSKSGAMTGWRLGWSIADESLTQAISTFQGHTTSGVSALSQAAALGAFQAGFSHFGKIREVYRNRRELGLAELQKSAKIKVFRPEGAFYFWIKVGKDAQTFAEALLQEEKVAVVPAGDFGASDCIRISFATDEKTVQEGCRRIADFSNRYLK